MQFEDVTEAADIRGMEQRIDWVRDEDECYPDPEDIEAAVRIVRGTIQPVLIHERHSLTIAQCMVLAHAETGDRV